MSCFSESCLSEIPEKASGSLLSEVVFPKLFRPKVFDFNVTDLCQMEHRYLIGEHLTENGLGHFYVPKCTSSLLLECPKLN